jgi:hypothetical protein
MATPNCYSLQELRDLGIRLSGTDVRIDRSVRFFGPEHISLGNRVRIDCFGLMSAGPAGITIGSNVHIAAGCYLFGADAAITMDDFSCLSSVVTLHASSDDFVEGHMTNPTCADWQPFRRPAGCYARLRRRSRSLLAGAEDCAFAGGRAGQSVPTPSTTS